MSENPIQRSAVMMLGAYLIWSPVAWPQTNSCPTEPPATCSDSFKMSAYLSKRVYEDVDEDKAYGRSFTADITAAPVRLTQQYQRFCSVETLDDRSTGTFARAFRDCRTGDVYIAYRGTEPTADYGIDLLVVDVQLGQMELSGNPAPVWSRTVRQSLQFAETIRSRVRAGTVGTCPGRQCAPLSGRILVTGHSLGGGIAQVVGSSINAETHTFNAPGVEKAVKFWGNPAQTSRILNHVRGSAPRRSDGPDPVEAATGGRRIDGPARDLVTRVGSHAGCVIPYPNSGYDVTVQEIGGIQPDASVGKVPLSTHSIDDFMWDALECNFATCRPQLARMPERRAEVDEEAKFFSDPDVAVRYGLGCATRWPPVQACYALASDLAARAQGLSRVNPGLDGIESSCANLRKFDARCEQLHRTALAICGTRGSPRPVQSTRPSSPDLSTP